MSLKIGVSALGPRPPYPPKPKNRTCENQTSSLSGTTKGRHLRKGTPEQHSKGTRQGNTEHAQQGDTP